MSKNEVSKNSRNKILNLENDLIKIADGVNVEGDGKQVVTDSKIAPIKHSFADGIYVRQMDMKQGSIVVGAIHKHLHVWFLLTGCVTVATEDTTEDYIAPCYVVSTPGVKRVILANEDSIFVNIHKNPSNTQDIDKLEKEIVALNYEEYEEYINKNK
jgi:quercetin dioxygenase-like cupin family protein